MSIYFDVRSLMEKTKNGVIVTLTRQAHGSRSNVLCGNQATQPETTSHQECGLTGQTKED